MRTEPRIPTSDDPDFHSISEDFERRFFAGDEQVTFEVTLMRETYDQIQTLMTEHNWQPNEGLIILLTTGIAYLRGERALTITGNEGEYNPADLKKLLERSISIESKYAAIRNFAFSLMRDHRTLEIKFDPVERECHALRTLVTQLRAENDALKAENEHLKLDAHPVSAAITAQPAYPDSPGRKGLWQRITAIFRGNP